MPNPIIVLFLLFQPGADGTLLHREAYQFPFETHEAWLNAMNGRGLDDWSSIFDKSAFDRYRENQTVSGSKMVYASSGLKIHGFLFVPENNDGKLPAVIYNRGGTAQWARITFWEILELCRLAERGYVVAASYLRGVGGSEGKPELGAGDIDDTLALIRLLENREDVDAHRIGMWGFSRGATTTYMTLARTDRIKVAVVCAGSGDAVNNHRRGEFEEHVYPKVLAGFEKDREKALRNISALYWAEELSPTTPILLLHGTLDKRVLSTGSVKMAEKLASLERTHDIRILEGASHSMIERFVEVRREIDRWFDRYLKGGSLPGGH